MIYGKDILWAKNYLDIEFYFSKFFLKNLQNTQNLFFLSIGKVLGKENSLKNMTFWEKFI